MTSWVLQNVKFLVMLLMLVCFKTTARCASIDNADDGSAGALASAAPVSATTVAYGTVVTTESISLIMLYNTRARRQDGANIRMRNATARIMNSRGAFSGDEGTVIPESSTEDTILRTYDSKESKISESASRVRSTTVTTTVAHEPSEKPTPEFTTNGTASRSKFLDSLRGAMKQVMSSVGSGLKRQLLQADISADCLIGIFQFMHAIQDLEPWALRLIDATGKYPTGLLQLSATDLGAYDECIETVVVNEHGAVKERGQYCNLDFTLGDDSQLLGKMVAGVRFSYPSVENFTSYVTDDRSSSARLGVCFIGSCNEQDLENIIRSVVGTSARITVSNCVKSVGKKIDVTQVAILALLAVLAAIIVAATAFDLFSTSWEKKRKMTTPYKCITAFSAFENSKLITSVYVDKDSESYRYQFVHGLRFLSIVSICLGHSYGFITSSTGRVINGLLYSEHWLMMMVYSGYIAVDTFFFLSGFFLYYVLWKQKKSRILVAVIAVLRRFVRCTVPLFFMIMCMYLLPLIASGPDSEEYYRRFYADVRKHWWHILIQIYNWKQDPAARITKTPFPHFWYLSADFQLFVVTVLVIQTFRTRKVMVASIFVLLSLVSCGISAWQVYDTDMTPFVVVVHVSYSTVMNTLTRYYMLPFYHGVCFFSGCVTFLLVETYGKTKIYKVIQTLVWFIALFCGLLCIFTKIHWYGSSTAHTDEVTRLFDAFCDRILWSIFLAWFTFACATGRGGIVSHFLAWKGFVPLSRLSFGVYLIHYPFYLVMHHVTRERIFYSHFTLVSQFFSVMVWSYILSFILFIACEGPTARLEKLVFMRERRRNVHRTEPDVCNEAALGEAVRTVPLPTRKTSPSTNA